MHANQLAVSLGTVRDLAGAQFPAWRRLTAASNPAMSRLGRRTLDRILASTS